MLQTLHKIFRPNSIAAIGASDKEESVGYALMHNLLTGEFKGTIYPVNKNHHRVQGQKAYSSVKGIPEKVDLAVIIS